MAEWYVKQNIIAYIVIMIWVKIVLAMAIFAFIFHWKTRKKMMCEAGTDFKHNA